MEEGDNLLECESQKVNTKHGELFPFNHSTFKGDALLRNTTFYIESPVVRF